MRTELHSAYVIHRRPYRETSLLLECLSADYGRVGVVARGAARSRNNLRGRVQSFQKYIIAWSGRSELHTLIKLEAMEEPLRLAGEKLFSGFYVNELIMRLTTRHDPNPEVFLAYEQTIRSLAEAMVATETTLRRFEKNLLDACGYGLQLGTEAISGDAIDPQQSYHYVFERGPTPANDAVSGILVSGQTLLALANDNELSELERTEAKKLMRYILHHYIGKRPLASRTLFRRASSPT
mgnify:CR=1 FL=1